MDHSKNIDSNKIKAVMMDLHFTCPECQKTVKVKSDTLYHDDEEEIDYVFCPECDNAVEIAYSEWMAETQVRDRWKCFTGNPS